MKTPSRWWGLGALGSTLAIVALAAALTAGAQAAGGFTSCANKTVTINVEGNKFPVTAKAISVQGTSCAAAYEFIRLAYRGEEISKTGYPQNYHCKGGEFKTPPGFLPTICTKPGKKIKYGQQGG